MSGIASEDVYHILYIWVWLSSPLISLCNREKTDGVYKADKIYHVFIITCLKWESFAGFVCWIFLFLKRCKFRFVECDKHTHTDTILSCGSVMLNYEYLE